MIDKLSRLLSPSPEFTRLAIADIETRNLTEKVVESWRPVLEAAIKEWVKQQRLSSVLGDYAATVPKDDTSNPAAGTAPTERQVVRRRFWMSLLERANARTDLHAGVSAGDGGWVATSTGGLWYSYVINQHESSVQFYIDRGRDGAQENKAIFDTLRSKQAEIERSFGESLSWERLDGKRACRIAKYFELGGYRDDEAKWPAIQDAMVDAMVRLRDSLAPFLLEC